MSSVRKRPARTARKAPDLAATLEEAVEAAFTAGATGAQAANASTPPARPPTAVPVRSVVKASRGAPGGSVLRGEVVRLQPLIDLPSRFQLVTAWDALQAPEAIEWVVERLFARASVSALVGDSKVGKTYAMLDLAVCVATGRPWLGLATERAPVLLVDEESGPRRLQRRLGEVLRGHGAESDVPVYGLTMGRLNFRRPADLADLQAAIERSGARLAVVDSLVDVTAGANENATQDMQPALMGVRHVAENTGAALVLIHHENKTGGYRGSSAIAGAVDALVTVKRKKGSPAIDFELERSRDTEPFQWAALADWGSGDTFRLCAQAAPDPSEELKAAILKALGAGPLNQIELTRHVKRDRSRVRAAVGGLVAAGQVKVERGEKNAIVYYLA